MTSAECQPRDPNRGTRPRGHGDPFQRKPLHNVDQAGARTDRRGSRGVVDADCVQSRDIHDHTAAGREAGVAVPAGPRHDANRVTPRPAHGSPDVLRGIAEHDRTGTDAVVARAVEAAGRVVGGVSGRDDRPLNQSGELDEPGVDRGA